MAPAVPGRPAVFVDRDDTLNQDCPYCRTPEQIHLLPTVAEGVRVLNHAGLPVVVVTNQSGIGRGLFTERDLFEMHAKLQADLALRGARLEAFYHCPHLPDSGCPDRKPSPGMLHRAARDLGLDLARSVVIGDRGRDVEMAWNAGLRAAMVPSAAGKPELERLPRAPDYLAPDFLHAAQWAVAALRDR